MYKEDLEIMVCDPNFPGETKILKADPANNIYYYKGDHDNTNCQWQTYFVNKNYNFANPPVVANPVTTTDGLVHQILLEIRTGNDDLRGGSDNLNITLNFNTKSPQYFPNINKGARWIGNYTVSVPITLITPVTQAEFKNILFNTAFRGGFDGDNWNMDMVQVLIDGKEIIIQAGSPLVRFTGDVHNFTLPFPLTAVTSIKVITKVPTIINDEIYYQDDN